MHFNQKSWSNQYVVKNQTVIGEKHNNVHWQMTYSNWSEIRHVTSIWRLHVIELNFPKRSYNAMQFVR